MRNSRGSLASSKKRIADQRSNKPLYGRGGGVGRGLGVGAIRGVGVGLGVGVTVAVAVGVAVGVAVAVGVGDGDPQGLTAQLKISVEFVGTTVTS